MIDLSYALRSKPSWWIKFKDPAIRTEWKREALQHQIRYGKLSEAEVEWVLDELEDYATMRDDKTGIQVRLPGYARSRAVSRAVSLNF